MGEILVVGLSHKTAPVDIREKLHVAEGQTAAFLCRLRSAQAVREALVLSTCNRVEVYAAAPPGVGPAAADAIEAALAERAGLAAAALRPRLYRHEGHEAAAHAFRVAASLESMVLGESQILAQVKAAYLKARGQGFTGPLLNGLMERTLRAGKRVRAETQIAALPVSVPSVAVDLARQVAGTLERSTVLLVGAGEMAELTARHLKAEGVRAIIVSNRNFDRAVALAGALGGRAARFDDLAAHLVLADVVIASTACPHPILRPPEIAGALRARRHRPLLLIDIAVPRNVDPACHDLDGAYVYDVDALAAVAAANATAREREAARAEAILEASLGEFAAWLRSLRVVPTIVDLRQKVQVLCEGELERAWAFLGDLGPAQRETVAALAGRIANKVLHLPSVVLKEAAVREQGLLYAEVARGLFGLDGRPPAEGGS
ncbi:MAG TPA: glutamyl-tRNA reductase [Candidatus Methylomirabilis sp.]